MVSSLLRRHSPVGDWHQRYHLAAMRESAEGRDFSRPTVTTPCEPNARQYSDSDGSIPFYGVMPAKAGIQ
jgi:hypothetical protein